MPLISRCLLCMLASRWACLAQADSNTASASGDLLPAPAFALAVVLVPSLIYFVRRRLIGKVNQQMLAVSAAESDGDDNQDAAAEIPAFQRLGLVFHDADRQFAGPVNSRVRAERRLFSQMFLTDFGVALGYAVIPALFGFFAFGQPASVGLAMGLGLAVFSLIRHLLHRDRLKAYDLSRSRGRQTAYRRLGRIVRGILWMVTVGTGATVINAVYVPDILRAIFGPRVRLILSGLFVVGTACYAIPILFGGGTDKAEAFGLLVAAMLHVYLFAVLARRLGRVAGLRLLILRVFSIDETSSFLFSGLMRYWRHFGNHLTIVDSSLLRQRYSNDYVKTVFLAFFLIAALLVAYVGIAERLLKSRQHDPFFWVWSCGVVAVLAVLPAWVALRIGERRVMSRFMRSHDQVRASLRTLEMRPRRLDLSFRHLQAMCHKNTWFLAVREFANCTDVVLMDLRGYTEQRQGCRKEVNFLFDAIPLPRLLFLVDTAAGKDMVEQMLRESWARLTKTSPNLLLPHPVVRLYRVRDNDERDMQAVLNLLITLATTPGGLEGVPTPAHAAAKASPE